MSLSIKDNLKNNRRPNFIGKNFNDFKEELLNYARLNFDNQISDFNETSLGGMLLDFASIIGESLSFYTEQQINELDYELATNPKNISRHLRKAGIKSNYASPSIVKVKFYLEINAIDNDTPDSLLLPVIKKGTRLSTESIEFILREDLDFRENYNIESGDEDINGNVETFILNKEGICASGKLKKENVFIPSDTNSLFIKYELQEEDISEIIEVIDSDFNTYYEVDYLSQDTVFIKSKEGDREFFETKYASHRFITETNYIDGKTSIRFGNGSNRRLKDDILINPEDISLPILGRSYESTYSLDPNRILKSNTLGISPQGKNLSIKYLYGGGSDSNVTPFSINNIDEIIIEFPNITQESILIESQKNILIGSISIENEESSMGGENRKTLEELKEIIPNSLLVQNRIVNHKDFLSRIYTMPSNFGRIHRTAVLSNPYSRLTKDIFILCKDINGFYANAPDSLKLNLKNYIEEFRIIGDSYNILDAPIYNFGIDLSVRVKEGYDVEEVLNSVAINIFNEMKFHKLQIGQGINVNDIVLITLNTRGVLTIISEHDDIIVNLNSTSDIFDEDLDEVFVYSNNSISISENYSNGIVYPTENGIFEIKYSIENIKVRNG